MTYEVKLTEVTKDAEKLIVYIARVSSPNQDNPEHAKLLRFCIKNRHWSVFEHGHMTVEIQTSRAIAQQILRHRSFTFQEFSQRYAGVVDGAVAHYEARRQAVKNRQSSVDDMDPETKEWWREAQLGIWDGCFGVYEEALERGIAKECARMVLPLATMTRIYMTGNMRSWIHYIELRTSPHAQKEHRDIALAIRSLFIAHFPIISEAMGWEEVR